MSHRTQITLTDEQYQRLLDESRRSGVGLAELIRRAVDDRYGQRGVEAVIEALDASSGCWAERSYDGRRYVEELRRGMARRLAGA